MNALARDRLPVLAAQSPARAGECNQRHSGLSGDDAFCVTLQPSPSATSWARTSCGRSVQATIRARISDHFGPVWKFNAPDSAPPSAKGTLFPAFCAPARVLAGLYCQWKRRPHRLSRPGDCSLRCVLPVQLWLPNGCRGFRFIRRLFGPLGS